MKKLLFLSLCCFVLSLPACSQNNSVGAAKKIAVIKNGNYVPNGDFEKVNGGSFSDWKVSGETRPEAASGAWKRLTTKFRSGTQKTVSFFFWIPRGASGSVWIDNLVIDPELPFKNGSFEEVEGDGALSGWQQTNKNETVFSDTARVSKGKKSVRITHAHEAIPATQIWQDFAVEPNKEYSLSLDMFVGDDFQGEAKGWMFNAAHSTSIDFDIENLLASKLVEDRDRLGRFAVSMKAEDNAPAELSQDVTVPAKANLRASLDLDNSAFEGKVKFLLEDLATRRVLHEIEVTKQEAKWQTKTFSLQSYATQIRVRVIATGQGVLRVDNLAVTSPQITPPLQQAQWLSATENFRIPTQLKVFVESKTSDVIDGGLALLNKDLKPYDIVVEKQNDTNAPLKILIGAKYAVKGKGDEAYSLSVNNKQIVIQAATESGAFYGLMTLLQLVDIRDEKPVFLPCKITDYPDMPMRGFLYADAEQAARWKMNTLMVSTGYPVTPSEKKDLRELVKKCRSLNLEFIPMFMTLQGGYYIEGINPNLAAGIWVQDEKVTLRGTEPSLLANRYVIRTGLTDVKLKSMDGTKEYVLGKDYQVIDGDMKYSYDYPNPKPFSVARLPGSSIPDGSTLLASYDYVSHMRKRADAHIPYVPLEPEVKKLTSDFLKGFSAEFGFSTINSPADLHEFFIQDAHLETDSRVIKSGKKPIELLVEDAHSQDAAIKAGNPKARLFQWTGDVGEYARAAAPHLPKDALIKFGAMTPTGPLFTAETPLNTGRNSVLKLRSCRGTTFAIFMNGRRSWPKREAKVMRVKESSVPAGKAGRAVLKKLRLSPGKFPSQAKRILWLCRNQQTPMRKKRFNRAEETNGFTIQNHFARR